MVCGLGEEERTKIWKKKKEKKKPHRGQKWVGWDERLSQDLQQYKIFFALLSCFD